MSQDTRLFVGNLPDNADEYALRQAFSSFGRITNLDLKTKVAAETNSAKRFAFVTLAATHNDIESCVNYFTSADFKGCKLYVTRARESFLERLQRERQEALLKDANASKNLVHKPAKKQPIIRLDERLNPQKRQLSSNDRGYDAKEKHQKVKHVDVFPVKAKPINDFELKPQNDKSPKKSNEIPTSPESKKKMASDKKRLESMKRKREEFKKKKIIINTGLSGIDKSTRKKVIFSDSGEIVPVVPTNSENNGNTLSNSLFDNDDDSGDDVNFVIKEQYEGIRGQKVLELQSRYKSDKRFILDERFVDDDDRPLGPGAEAEVDEGVDLGQTDEKAKQLNILQDVLGVHIKSSLSRQETTNDKKKTRSRLGMLRFDPMQPEHARFLAPVGETKQEHGKKSKKNKSKEDKQQPESTLQNIEKVEVSKETFYKVSDTLKEAIAQPNTFSLRSLFIRDSDIENKEDDQEEDSGYIPLEKPKEPKVRNPFDKGEANPFKYDSSDSEVDENITKNDTTKTEVKAIWNEKFFFAESDPRLAEGVAFFSKRNDYKGQKDRRELKSLMKKRLYNRERKDQMFKKKIGGRRKSGKKSFRRKNN